MKSMRGSTLTKAAMRRRVILVIALCVLVIAVLTVVLVRSHYAASGPDPRTQQPSRYPAPTAPAPEPSPRAQEPISPLPLTVSEDPARIQLGERLFSDVQLSRDRSRSCATCHPLDSAGMDGAVRAYPLGASKKLLRNTPTIFNVRYYSFFNWDGATESLQIHDEKVLLSPALMAIEWPELLTRLRANQRYASEFAQAYPAGITRVSVLDALATYERTLVTPNSRLDKFLRGDRAALSASEQQGYQRFKSYGCVACHQGINIGGNLLQTFGVFVDTSKERREGEEVDLGRYVFTHDELDRQVFRVPSLRNVAMTAPYFHDGRAATLEDAVRTMARVQLGRAISPEDVGLIVQFLGTLTGEYEGRPVLRRRPLEKP